MWWWRPVGRRGIAPGGSGGRLRSRLGAFGADTDGQPADRSDEGGLGVGSEEPADGPGDGGVGVDSGPSYVPPERDDGLILVFEEGSLGPVSPGATRSEIERALGPDFEVTPVGSIRAGFGPGYSVSWDGEVLFWAIGPAIDPADQSDDQAGAADGPLTLFMTTSPKVGLPSGLRPQLPLADAIDLHGEPSLTLGSEQREFATFSDGTGNGGPVAVLVAIGQFGGPVGLYDGPGGQSLDEADGYILDDANVKELWFGDAGR